MVRLTTEELQNTNGGISFGILGGIVMGAVFLAPVIYGFINPNRCN